MRSNRRKCIVLELCIIPLPVIPKMVTSTCHCLALHFKKTHIFLEQSSTELLYSNIFVFYKVILSIFSCFCFVCNLQWWKECETSDDNILFCKESGFWNHNGAQRAQWKLFSGKTGNSASRIDPYFVFSTLDLYGKDAENQNWKSDFTFWKGHIYSANERGPAVEFYVIFLFEVLWI